VARLEGASERRGETRGAVADVEGPERSATASSASGPTGDDGLPQPLAETTTMTAKVIINGFWRNLARAPCVVTISMVPAKGMVFMFGRFTRQLPGQEQALPGRPHRSYNVSDRHSVLDVPLNGPLPTGYEVVLLGLGCFWGAERVFWQTKGVTSTSVGYAGGLTPHPTYEEVCSGMTGHTEAVRVVYDPVVLSFESLLTVFWESHDPTQGMRQGNDAGTQYRSAIYWMTEAQRVVAERSRESYQRALTAAGRGPITTEILPAGEYYLAEDYHQQYLHKVPHGYCGLGGTGVSCPT
jgi:peptide-methionine (S)-S-oxide reductase